MFLIRWFGAAMAEVYGNMGIAIGLIFALVILLRPVTNTLLRPKHWVAFWIGAWTMGWSWSFWRMARLIRVLPVTFLGIIAPKFDDRDRVPVFIPELSEAGEKVFTLPGGKEIPFVLTEWMSFLLPALAAAGFVLVMIWMGREEKKVKKLCRAGEPLSREWHEAHGLTDGSIIVSVMEGLPTSFVCRTSPGVHHICLQKELPEEQMELVLKHELAHIRGSHVWFKGLLAGMMCFYWWNPLIWAAYRLACRDIELACDEAVMKELDEKQRRTYARTLVELGSGKHLWGGLTCFGESDAEIRVRRVVNWKPEPEWVTVLAWPAVILMFLFLFTSPRATIVERHIPWLNFVQGPGLVLDVREMLGDPEVNLEEVLERDQASLIRDEDRGIDTAVLLCTDRGEWYKLDYHWNDKTLRYDLMRYVPITEEPAPIFKSQFNQVRAWNGEIKEN